MEEIKLLVSSIRNPIKYKEKCQKEQNLLLKCIYCKKYLAPTQWAPLLESFIKKKFKILQKNNEISGDGCSENGKNIEIKISLGDRKNNFNFVQIRPDHEIDFYLFMCFDIFSEEFGKIYWFLCPAKKLYELLPEYGDYSHGTIKKNGKISEKNLFGKGFEYSLRTGKRDLFEKLTKLFLSNEMEILKKLTV